MTAVFQCNGCGGTAKDLDKWATLIYMDYTAHACSRECVRNILNSLPSFRETSGKHK